MKNPRPSSLLALASMLLALSLPACMPRRSNTQELARDLTSYSTEMQKWEPTEKQIFDQLDAVEDSQYVDDEFVLRSLKGALPEIDRHLRDVSGYRPTTNELATLHEHYRKGWEDLRAGIDKMIAAVSKKDYVALSKGKSEMNQARATLLRAFAGMNALMEENEELMKRTRKS